MAVDFLFKDKYNINDLIEIVRILRAPGGCPYRIDRLRDGFLMLRTAFDLVPVRQNLVRRIRLNIAENVRVTDNQLFAYTVGNVVEIKRAVFALNVRMNRNLQKHVAQLLAELCGDEHSALGIDAVLILTGQSASPFRRSLKLL